LPHPGDSRQRGPSPRRDRPLAPLGPARERTEGLPLLRGGAPRRAPLPEGPRLRALARPRVGEPRLPPRAPPPPRDRLGRLPRDPDGRRRLPLVAIEAGDPARTPVREDAVRPPPRPVGRRGPQLMPGGLPILTYHSLDRSGSVLSTDPSWFAETLAALAD